MPSSSKLEAKLVYWMKHFKLGEKHQKDVLAKYREALRSLPSYISEKQTYPWVVRRVSRHFSQQAGDSDADEELLLKILR